MVALIFGLLAAAVLFFDGALTIVVANFDRIVRPISHGMRENAGRDTLDAYEARFLRYEFVDIAHHLPLPPDPASLDQVQTKYNFHLAQIEEARGAIRSFETARQRAGEWLIVSAIAAVPVWGLVGMAAVFLPPTPLLVASVVFAALAFVASLTASLCNFVDLATARATFQSSVASVQENLSNLRFLRSEEVDQ